MITLKKAKVPALSIMCAFGIAAAALWIGGQSQAASAAPLTPGVESPSTFVQDNCVDSALRLKLMVHGSGLIPNVSSGDVERGCGNDGLSATDVDSLHSASAAPDSHPTKPSPEKEKS